MQKKYISIQSCLYLDENVCPCLTDADMHKFCACFLLKSGEIGPNIPNSACRNKAYILFGQ